jgi:hypothetical protein
MGGQPFCISNRLFRRFASTHDSARGTAASNVRPNKTLIVGICEECEDQGGQANSEIYTIVKNHENKTGDAKKYGIPQVRPGSHFQT